MRSISLQPKKSQNNIGSYLFSGSVYRATLGRKWAECLLYSIFLALMFPILILFIASNSRMFIGSPNVDAADRLLSSLMDGVLGTQSVIAHLWGIGSGLISALLSASYLFDKRQSGFVCALPVKRSAYAISNAVASLCSAIVSWIPAALLLCVISLCNPLLRVSFGQIMAGFFGAFVLYLCLYLFYFGLTSMAAALCGTMPMTVLMTLFFSLYPVLLYLLTCGAADVFLRRLDVSYYTRNETISKISGFVRLFGEIGNEKPAAFLLSTAALGLLYFAIFVLFSFKRKNEETGRHFVWSFAREGVKYLCMIFCGLAGGLIFHELSDNSIRFVWMLVGIAIGVVIVWMLCNLVFFKTSGMLFYAKRGMAITLVCLMLFMSALSVDILGLDDYVPSVGMTSSITFRSEVGDLEIKDRNLIRMYLAMIKNGVAADDDTEYLSPDSFGVISSLDGPISIVRPEVTDSSVSKFSTTHLYSVFHTKFLFPIARGERVLANDYRTFISAYTGSRNFIENFMQPLNDFIQSGKTDDVYGHVSFATTLSNNISYAEVLTKEQYKEFASIYEKEIRALGDNPMQHQIVGNVYVYSPTINYPIFADCKESIAWLEKAFDSSMPHLPSEEELAKYTVSITLCRDDRAVKELTAAEFLAYIESGAISLQTGGLGNSYTQYLTLYDADYSIHVRCTKDMLYQKGEIAVDMYEDQTSDLSYYVQYFYFLEGKAPKA